MLKVSTEERNDESEFHGKAHLGVEIQPNEKEHEKEKSFSEREIEMPCKTVYFNFLIVRKYLILERCLFRKDVR